MPVEKSVLSESRTAKSASKLFLEEMRIDHGPASLLGRFFLQAETIMRAAGIKLCFAPLAEAAITQAQNTGSWPLFPPMLDCRLSAIPEDMSYSLIGYGPQW